MHKSHNQTELEKVQAQLKELNDWLQTNHASTEWGEKYKQKTDLLRRKMDIEKYISQEKLKALDNQSKL